MPSLQSILSVALAGFALSAVPGPSMLYVLSRSVGQSRAAGLASALGLCLGGILLAIATALGLASLFARFEGLVLALRYLGSAYLVWLGVGMIRSAHASARQEIAPTDVSSKPMLSIMWQGVLVELLNPKTVLFFALFLPPFVTLGGEQAGNGNVTVQLLILGSLVPLTAVPSDLVVAAMGGAMTKTLNGSRQIREIFAWVGGLTLIGLAGAVLWETL